MIELGLLALTIAGFLVFLDRKDQRQHERDQAHRLEVTGLCQRIQAPELAVAQHAAETAGPEEMLPLTDEQIAEQQEAFARMDSIEREFGRRIA